MSHILLQLPLQSSSCALLNLDCRPLVDHLDLLLLESGELTTKRSPLRRYRDRLSDAENPDEVATFDSALRLYYTQEEVRMTNVDSLAATDRAVMKILEAGLQPGLRRRQILYLVIFTFVLELE